MYLQVMKVSDDKLDAFSKEQYDKDPDAVIDEVKYI